MSTNVRGTLDKQAVLNQAFRTMKLSSRKSPDKLFPQEQDNLSSEKLAIIDVITAVNNHRISPSSPKDQRAEVENQQERDRKLLRKLFKGIL